jgi:hypothetical protein
LISGSCVCEDYYFENNGNCSACDLTCLYCTGNQSNQCELCSELDFRSLVNGSCTCNEGYYHVSNNHKCQ